MLGRAVPTTNADPRAFTRISFYRNYSAVVLPLFVELSACVGGRGIPGKYAPSFMNDLLIEAQNIARLGQNQEDVGRG